MSEQPWHVGSAFERELFCGEKRMATCTTHETAVEIAAMMNAHASAELVAWGLYAGDSLGACFVTYGLAVNHKKTYETIRPLYAAPPAPEPPAEVEWRVSKEELHKWNAEGPPRLDYQAVFYRLLFDLRDARAALARRPDPAPATEGERDG